MDQTKINMQEYISTNAGLKFFDQLAGGICTLYFAPDYEWCPKLTYANEGFFEIFGYQRAEWFDLFHENALFPISLKDRKKIICAQRKFLHNQKPYSVICQSMHKSGREIWIAIHASGERNPDHSIIEHMIVTDMTAYFLQDQACQKQLSLRWMMNYGGIFTVAVDESLSLLHGNDKFYQIHEYTKESFERELNNQYSKCIGQKDLLKIREYVQFPWVQEKHTLEWEMPVLSGKGNLKHLLVSGVLRNEQGQVLLKGVAIDITNRKEAQQRYESRVKMLSENSTNSVGSFRLNLTRNWCGDGYSIYPEILALQTEGTVDDFFENVYKRSTNLIHPGKYRSTFGREQLLQAYSRGETVISRDHLYRVTDESPVWLHTELFITKNPYTSDVEVFITSRNIHTEKILQQLTQHSVELDYDQFVCINAKTNHFFSQNNPNSLSYLLPSKGKDFVHANDLRMQKCVAPEILAEILEKMSLPYVVEQLEKQDSYLIYCDMKLKNGACAKKKFHFSYIDRENQYIALRESDITHYFLEEEEQRKLLFETLEATRQAGKAKTELLSRMSHEIRTPLNSIIGMASIAKMSVDQQDKVMDCIEKIEVSSKYLLGIINDTLDMSRIESGKVTLSQERFQIATLVRKINDICIPQAKAKRIRFICTIDESVGESYTGDEIKLQQVLVNLLSNAIKFTQAGGHVALRISVKERAKEHDSLCFEVQDNGCGIDRAYIDKIFDPFEQGRKNIATFGKGTGLGLSICKNLVQLMDGTIQVQSQKNVGSTFTVKVKLISCNQKEKPSNYVHHMGTVYCEAAFMPEETENDALLQGKHVLLVEDHPLNIEIMTKFLEDKGIVVDYAQNGVQAIEKFAYAYAEYDLILMDIQMPIMDGLEATKKIRHLQVDKAQTIPIIAMTANAFNQDIEKSKDVGMNAHLTKPIFPNTLYDTLNKYMV